MKTFKDEKLKEAYRKEIERNEETHKKCLKEMKELSSKLILGDTRSKEDLPRIKQQLAQAQEAAHEIKREKVKVDGHLTTLRPLLYPIIARQEVNSDEYFQILPLLLKMQISLDERDVDLRSIREMIRKQGEERRQAEESLQYLFQPNQLQELMTTAAAKGMEIHADSFKDFIANGWDLIFQNMDSLQNNTSKTQTKLHQIQQFIAGPQLATLLEEKFDVLMKTNLESLHAGNVSMTETQMKTQADLIANIVITQSTANQNELLAAVRHLARQQGGTNTDAVSREVLECLHNYKKEHSEVFTALYNKLLAIDGNVVGLFSVVGDPNAP